MGADFKDIYVNLVLGEIKDLVFGIINVESNYDSININEAEVNADSKMLDVLREILTGDSLDSKELKYNFSLLSSVKEMEFNVKFKQILMFYYTALYFDNLDLLKDLFRENLCRLTDDDSPNIYLLDSDFTDVFSDDYIKIVLKFELLLGYFYNSIKDVFGEERKKYFNKVARILLARCDLNTYCEQMLEKERLDYIDEETYLNVNVNQLIALSTFYHFEEIEDIERFNKLMRDTGMRRFGHSDAIYINKLMELFDDDEIKTICNNDLLLQNLFHIHKDCYEKLLLLIKQNMLIIKYPGLCSERFLGIIEDGSEIANMTDADFKYIEENIDKLYFMGRFRARRAIKKEAIHRKIKLPFVIS